MMRNKFLFFLFLPFFAFSAYTVDTITVTGIPWNSSSGKNSDYQIQSVPFTITFVSGDTGTGIKCGSGVWLLSPGDSIEITSDTYIGLYVFATSSNSSPSPASATFSVSYGEGGSGSGGSGSGGITPDPGGGSSGYATEQTLANINSKLNQTNQNIQNIYNYWNSGNGYEFINDIWNATQYGAELLENIDSSFSDLNSSLDDLYDLLDLMYTDVSDIKTSLTNLEDLFFETFNQPSYERPEPPTDSPFGSLFSSMKSKIYPNYNFFTISGTNFPVWVFPFHLENYGGRYFEVAVDINKWQTVFGGIIPTICNFLRSLLKVLCAYYFFRVVNLTWRQF